MKKLIGVFILTLILGCSLPGWAADVSVEVDRPSDPVGDIIAAPFNFIGQVFSGDGTVVGYDPDVYGYYGYAEPGYNPSIYRWGYWQDPWYYDRYDYWYGPRYYNYWGGGWGGHHHHHHHGHHGGGHHGGGHHHR